MVEKITCAKRLTGTVELPGDKSISHRALMLSAIAAGESRIENLSDGQDVQSTRRCLTQLGVKFRERKGQLVVRGVGLAGLRQSRRTLDVGNSGTTMRLLAGILAGQPFTTVISGDDSIRKRPMARIIEPLRRMGAQVNATNDEFAPIEITGATLKPITYQPPVASAQVKSCILLAGLYADGTTTVKELAVTRYHTELMLALYGAPLDKEGLTASVTGPAPLMAQDLFVPGDFSSAAFFIAGATLLPGSELLLRNVGLNPTRRALLSLLCDFGADMQILNVRTMHNEIMADLLVTSSKLGGMQIGAGTVPQIIDEIPILAVMATQAQGRTEITGAKELRYKESDRVKSIVSNLQRMGASVAEHEDGLTIDGPVKLRGAAVESFDDHRIAMSFAVAGLLAEGETTVNGSECIDISYPGFLSTLRRLCAI